MLNIISADIKRFEDINSWKAARSFCKEIYALTEANHKFNKDVELTRQIRRACISISSNIAEGFERDSNKEFVRFLYIAKGSAGECRSQLYLAFDLMYITKEEFEKLVAMVTDISKLISGLIKYLKSTY